MHTLKKKFFMCSLIDVNGIYNYANPNPDYGDEDGTSNETTHNFLSKLYARR